LGVLLLLGPGPRLFGEPLSFPFLGGAGVGGLNGDGVSGDCSGQGGKGFVAARVLNEERVQAVKPSGD